MNALCPLLQSLKESEESTVEKRKSFSYAKYGYMFIIPFVAAYLVFSLYPTIYTLILGFTDAKGVGKEWHFLKEDIFKNFKVILANDVFRTALKNTFKIWIINFIPQILLALLLTAWFTSTHNKLKGQGFFKVVLYMPNIITAATIAVLFYAMFGYPKGPMNDILMSLGIIDGPFAFTQNKLASQLIVAFIQFWQWYGYTMLILISGVLGISPDIFEAADLDGANSWQTFFHITLPNLKTILLFTLVTSVIGGLNMFDIPKLFNDGMPDNATVTASVFIFKQAFSGAYMYARAAAASMIMFVIIAIITGLLFYFMRDRDAKPKKY